MSTDDARELLAEHFRRDLNGAHASEIECRHRSLGIDPMRCNDSVCLRAVYAADALLASPQFARLIEQREAAARAEGRREVREAVERLLADYSLVHENKPGAPGSRERIYFGVSCDLRAVLAGQGGESGEGA